YNLGASLVRSGEFTEAERHLRAALKKNPNTETYTALGISLWQQGRLDKAMANLRAAIDADPNNAAPYDALGTILVQQGKLEEAASVYRDLIRNRPSAAAHRELAQVLTRLGHDDEARKEMDIAKALDLGVRAAQ
ncbi:MAG: tetratricopeptide repeat protein, partial [Polyangiales bacterium]